jgi:hypothetical protein
MKKRTRIKISNSFRNNNINGGNIEKRVQALPLARETINRMTLRKKAWEWVWETDREAGTKSRMSQAHST